MSVIAGIFSGVLVGFYFAEKNASFPVRYVKRTDGRTGSLVLDLQIVDHILYDVKTSVGYSSEVEPAPENAEPHI
jgi:hypothetical protein